MRGRAAFTGLALCLLPACGGAADEPADPAPGVTVTATAPAPEPSTVDPTLPKPSSGSIALTGVVGEADENGCVTLTTTGAARATWLLVGSTSGVTAGATATVRGSPAPDLATRCQQGTPFVVETVEPG